MQVVSFFSKGVAFPNRTVSGCGTTNAAGVAQCTTLIADVTPDLTVSISAGPLPIKIAVNADCSDSLNNAVFGLPTPLIETVTPSRVCHIATASLAIRGARFAFPPTPTLTAESGGSGPKAVSIGTPTDCVLVGFILI